MQPYKAIQRKPYQGAASVLIYNSMSIHVRLFSQQVLKKVLSFISRAGVPYTSYHQPKEIELWNEKT